MAYNANPYHSFRHAVDVVHTVARFLTLTASGPLRSPPAARNRDSAAAKKRPRGRCAKQARDGTRGGACAGLGPASAGLAMPPGAAKHRLPSECRSAACGVQEHRRIFEPVECYAMLVAALTHDMCAIRNPIAPCRPHSARFDCLIHPHLRELCQLRLPALRHVLARACRRSVPPAPLQAASSPDSPCCLRGMGVGTIPGSPTTSWWPPATLWRTGVPG